MLYMSYLYICKGIGGHKRPRTHNVLKSYRNNMRAICMYIHWHQQYVTVRHVPKSMSCHRGHSVFLIYQVSGTQISAVTLRTIHEHLAVDAFPSK